MHIKRKVATCQACKPQEEEVGQVCNAEEKKSSRFPMFGKRKAARFVMHKNKR
jgi:hypothetical protein